MNAYRSAYRRQRVRAAASDGWQGRAVRVGLSVSVLAALVPVVRAVFLPFLDAPADAWAQGLAAVWLRAGLFAMVAVALTVHATVLRGPARPVLALHPVDPVAVVWAELAEAARARRDVLVALGVLLAPIGWHGGAGLWALGMVVVLGAWCGALTLSAVVFLGAIEVAESPRWSPWLDVVRGVNPRAQAAVIWALAPSTLLGGALTAWAAGAAVAVWQGSAGSAVWMLLPFVVALASVPAIPRLAARAWYAASVVLADIRARYDAVEQPEEAHRVYLDWVAGWLPTPVARWMLLDLRHAWRAHRSWVSGTWLVAVGALAAGWTSDPMGPVWAGIVGGAGAWLAGMLVVIGAVEEPAFLRVWLPRQAGVRAAARGAAVVAWSMAPVGTAMAAVGVRQGAGAAITAGCWAGAMVVLAAACAALAGQARARGRAPYVAMGLVSTGAAAWLGVWGGPG